MADINCYCDYDCYPQSYIRTLSREEMVNLVARGKMSDARMRIELRRRMDPSRYAAALPTPGNGNTRSILRTR